MSYSDSSFQNKTQKRKMWGSLKDCNYGRDPIFISIFNKTIDNLWKNVIKYVNSSG